MQMIFILEREMILAMNCPLHSYHALLSQLDSTGCGKPKEASHLAFCCIKQSMSVLPIPDRQPLSRVSSRYSLSRLIAFHLRINYRQLGLNLGLFCMPADALLRSFLIRMLHVCVISCRSPPSLVKGMRHIGDGTQASTNSTASDIRSDELLLVSGFSKVGIHMDVCQQVSAKRCSGVECGISNPSGGHRPECVALVWRHSVV